MKRLSIILTTLLFVASMTFLTSTARAQSNYFAGGTSGNSNTGSSNTFINSAGENNTSGSHNTFVGFFAGQDNISGGHNVYLGRSTGRHATGSHNTFLGQASGRYNTGSRNVFIGYKAGYSSTDSDKLRIANSGSSNLIYGDFATGQVGINMTSFPTTAPSGASLSTFRFFVSGGILAEEIRVESGWADYVFEDNYYLTSLQEVNQHIQTYGYLHNTPSADEIEGNGGVDLGEMTVNQQEKIEEIFLHLIEMDKTIKALQAENAELKKQLQQ